MLHITCASAGNDGYVYRISKYGKCFIGKALFNPVVIHTCKKNFSGTSVSYFLGPFKEVAFRSFTASFHVTMPSIGIVSGVNSAYTNLRSEEHTSELQSRQYLVCRLLLEKKKSF